MIFNPFLVLYGLIVSLSPLSIKHGEYVLFSEGKSDYVIVVSSKASDSEKYAAEELQSCIKKISGATLPITDCGGGQKGRRIIVGYNKDSKQLFSDEKERATNDESFSYKSKSGDIAIFGGRDRGTMYGVFSFLENELGCRWYTETFSLFPARHSYTFSIINHSEKPLFPRRSLIYSEINDPLFRVHSRLNERLITKPYTPIDQIGGGYYFLSPHTFSFILPVEEYYSTHPEYFALVNGKRESKQPQPCFSNPEVLRICIREVRKIMRDHPEYDTIEISSLDNNNLCECENCKRIINSLGNYTDLVLSFVNKVAESLIVDFPDKQIEFLAYSNTCPPPLSVKPNKNVLVRICNSQACHIHSFTRCNDELTTLFCRSINGWKEVTNNLSCWEYAVDYVWYNIPFPNFYALRDNLIQYQKLGLTSAFVQGNNYSYNGEFQALRVYVLSKLLWNPYCDLEVLIDDFINSYYGSSAKYIRQYFNLIHSYIQDNTHLTPFSNYTENYYTDALITEARELFSKAKSVADNQEVLRRVEIEEFSICLLETVMNPRKAKNNGSYEQTRRILQQENIKVGSSNSEKVYQRSQSTANQSLEHPFKDLLRKLASKVLH